MKHSDEIEIGARYITREQWDQIQSRHLEKFLHMQELLQISEGLQDQLVFFFAPGLVPIRAEISL